MLEMFALPFMQRALVATVLLALMCGVFGVFVMLRKMSFFADAISHASLAGIAVGVVLGVSPNFATLVASLLVACLIALLMKRTQQSLDTIIGIAYALALAVGVMLLSVTKGLRANINTYLFGDILGADWNMIALMAAVLIVVFAALLFTWKRFVLMSVQPDLASVQGVHVPRMELVFMLMLAAVVAVGIKIAGIILVGPMLIIPAATAKNVSVSMLQTVGLSVVFALVSGVLGLMASYILNVPSGPAMIVMSGMLFFASMVKGK